MEQILDSIGMMRHLAAASEILEGMRRQQEMLLSCLQGVGSTWSAPESSACLSGMKGDLEEMERRCTLLQLRVNTLADHVRNQEMIDRTLAESLAAIPCFEDSL